LLNVVLTAQIIAIFVLFVELLYIIGQRPSKMQVLLIMLVTSTIVMLIGYLTEILAKDEGTAMLSVAFSYIGKPYALLASFLFIAEYCSIRVPRNLVVGISVLNLFFPIIIFTNSMHHLYYSTIVYDASRPFSPLILGHGPLYYSYMVVVIANFIVSLVMIVREYRRSATRDAKKQTLYLFGMIGSSVVGYIVFLTGMTAGYDTTMIGAFVGTLFITLLFFRFRLFDSLTLAKEQALNDASSGLLVLNQNNKTVYTNAMIRHLLLTDFTKEELKEMPVGEVVIRRNDRVYECKTDMIIDKGRTFGKTVELTDITEKYQYSEKLERDVESRTHEIQSIQRSIITSFAGIVEVRDNSTGVHIKRMSRYVEIIAKSLQKNGDYADEITDEFITRLVDVSPLHDIGKLSIPDTILLKPGRLTPEEFDVIKTHTLHGARIIKECLEGVESPEYVDMAEKVALSHHEKWNGQGYPEQKAGLDIPLCARIVAVSDVYDAIRSVRCYKPPMTPSEARQVIEEGRGNHFDPTIVDAFLRALPEIESVVV